MTKLEKIIFGILSDALSKGSSSQNLILSPSEWKELGEMAIRQGVGSLVWEQLKSGWNNMPEDIKSGWEAYADFSSRRFDAQLLALSHLSTVLENEGLRMMPLKGLGLALCYPRPELRECNDIDIYCFDDFDRVNSLLSEKGLCTEMKESEEKHVVFCFDGIEVENHRKFTTEYNKASILVGRILRELSAGDTQSFPELPGMIFPSPLCGALHLVFHTLSHLVWSELTLRQLCDIVLYFRKYSSQLDVRELQRILKDAGIDHSAAFLFDICEKYLGLTNYPALRGTADEKSEEIILNSIFKPIKSSADVADPLRKILIKLFTFRRRRVLHKIIYKEVFPASFLKSFSVFRKAE